MRESGSLDSEDSPAVVHCSAGIGRSGSFILVDSCLLEAENSGPESVNIKQRLLDMRTYRMGLIQTDDQLKFSYQAIIEVRQHSWRSKKYLSCFIQCYQGARGRGLITLVPELESPVAEASDSSDDDECPPPLPPPRTESLNPGAVENGEESEEVRLGARMITITDAEPLNTLHNSSKMNGDLTPGDSVSSSSSDNSPSKCILTNNKLEEKKRFLILFP